MKNIKEYETTGGKKPFREWLDSLDYTVAFRIQARLDREASGNLGDVRSVGDSISELRLKFGAGYRIYFAQYKKDIVILLCGGDKGSQNNDIKTAKSYWADFKRRFHEKIKRCC